MSDKTVHDGNIPHSDMLTTVGSAAAIVGALGAMGAANWLGPTLGALLTAGSTAVAAGALYLKLTGHHRQEIAEAKHRTVRRAD